MGTGRKRRALIVDDHHGTRHAMRRLLQFHGFETHEAATLADARSKLGCCEFVLTDLDLPDGNGVDLIREVRDRGEGAKVVVVSGVADTQLLAAVDAQGPDAIFPKPILFSRLLDWLESHL
jgi:DNA-binding NarL/FixJ family response regulator